MSIINKLTEGIVNRDMTAEGEALLNKWSSTGLLEGLDGDVAKNNMARLLENQAKQLLKEASSMGTGGAVDGFAAVAFPIVRRVFAGLIANDLVSVQPMSLPSGLIFFLDFTYGGTVGDTTSARGGNEVSASVYGTNQTGSAITGGVDLTNSFGAGFSGPGRDGQVGYSYASPTGTNVAALTNGTHIKVRSLMKLDGATDEDQNKLIQFDPDLLAETTLGAIVIDINKAELESIAASDNADYENLSAFILDKAAFLTFMNGATGVAALSAVANIQQVRRLTRLVDATDSATGAAAVRFVWTTDEPAQLTEANTAVNGAGDIALGKVTFPVKDGANSSATSGGALNSYSMLMEAVDDIPEINIIVDSTAITAQTKKLKAKWSPELGQDLNAYHNLDAEVELTSILSEQVALEIDREILADLVNGATAAKYYWSRSPGLFVNRVTGGALGSNTAAPDFTGTVSEWYETLIETINDVSAAIHRKTLRGGANFVVCSPEVANILEFTAGFRANVTADADKGEIGAVKVGSLSRKFDVIVDPYFPRNVILCGRKGNSFLESGYVYAPYVPLQVTPTIFGVEDFVPRKGVMTRYAKKMVRPDMYGLVIIRGLLGEEE